MLRPSMSRCITGRTTPASSTCCVYLEPDWRAQLAHAVGHVGLIGALRRISGSADRGRARRRPDSPDERLDRALELMGEQRLEWRTAARTLARTAVSPMDTRRRD